MAKNFSQLKLTVALSKKLIKEILIVLVILFLLGNAGAPGHRISRSFANFVFPKSTIATHQNLIVGKLLQPPVASGGVDPQFGSKLYVPSDSGMRTTPNVLQNGSISLSSINLSETPSNNLYLPFYDDSHPGITSTIYLSNPSSAQSLASVNVTIGSSSQNFSVPAQDYTMIQFTGQSGPVSIASDTPLVGAEIISDGITQSLINAIGQLSSTCYFTLYDSLKTDGFSSSNIDILNPGTTTASVQVIAGPDMQTASISPQQLYTISFPSLKTGPVSITSSNPVAATMEFHYNSQYGYVYEGATNCQVAPTQSGYFPFYDDVSSMTGLADYISLANPENSSAAATVQISFPNYTYVSKPIVPNSELDVSFPNLKTGPVTISSNVPILASQRSFVGQTYTDTPMLTTASQSLYSAIYDSQETPNGQLCNVNVSNVSSAVATVKILIGSIGSSQTITLNPGQSQTVNFQNVIGGPLQINSSANIISSISLESGPPPPTVSGISPDVGSIAGGTSVNITGSNFVGPVSVYFGWLKASSVTVNSSTSITAISPPGPQGQFPVTVRAFGGSSSASSNAQFSYVTFSVKFQSGQTGYDLSWPQCPNNFPPTPGNFTVIGADDGHPFSTDPCLQQLVNFAGNNFALYAVIFWQETASYETFSTFPINCATASNQNQCFAYNYGYNAAQWIYKATLSSGISSNVWWLDIEGAAGSSNPLWSSDLAANSRAVQGAIDFFSSQLIPGSNSNVTVGIYSSTCVWQQIVGGSSSVNGLGCVNYQGYRPMVFNWVANWNDPSNPSTFCSSNYGFAGGPTLLVQYTDNVMPTGSTGPFDGDFAC